jgi:Sulfatase
MNFKTFVEGFGAAILVLLLRIWPQLSPHHQVLYHSFLPMQSMVWGVLIDLVVVTLLAALLFWYLQRREAGRRNIVWAWVAALLLPVLFTNAAFLLQVALPHLYTELLFYGALVAALLLRWVRPAIYLGAIRGLRLLLVLVGCSVVWMLPELLYQCLRAQPTDALMPVLRASPASVHQTTPPNGRIVWLLFDELSYEQAFEHRFPGLSLPAFDQLKSESVSFSDLQPVGYDTERVVPSFFLGHVVDAIRSDLDGRPSIRRAGENAWQPFDPHTTLFADAQRLGWTTGVVGWYNPYCRILAGTLDYCFWRMGNGQWNGTTPTQSAIQNAIVPLANELRSWGHKPSFAQEEKHASDLAAVVPQAEALIRNQQIGFVFIHLPVPHPPGIYDRRPPHQRRTGTYIDNLALADRTLAELMRTIQETPLAAKTTVILCSDHSWRVNLWRPTPQWSKEEAAASHNRFDPRPVLMIHFPGQTTERDVTSAFDDIRIHDILERMLRGQPPVFNQAGAPVASSR